MRWLLELLAKILGTRVTPPPVPTPTPVPPSPSDVPDQLLAVHNERRNTNGLPPLKAAVTLRAAAQSHADFMASVGKMAHSGIGDGSLGTRLQAVGYTYRFAGENIACGQRTVQAVMDSWMASPGHRANALGNYSEGGFAVAYGMNGVRYWCSVFATPARSAFADEDLRWGVAATIPEVTADPDSAASSIAIEIVTETSVS